MSATDVIVLVGGFGTRLRSVVPDLPKPLAPVAGRPFLARLLDRYAAAGMRRVVLATGYRSEMIEQVIGATWQGMEIVYSREDQPLGTGGAIRLAGRHVGAEGAFVANGDTFLRFAPTELEAATLRMGVPMGVALVPVADVRRHGAVQVEGGLVRGFREKGSSGPGLINAGSYFLTAEALARLPAEEAYSFEERVLTPWSVHGQVAAFDRVDAFIDIGIPQDYARAQLLLAGV